LVYNGSWNRKSDRNLIDNSYNQVFISKSKDASYVEGMLSFYGRC